MVARAEDAANVVEYGAGHPFRRDESEAPMKVFHNLDELKAAAGESMGTSEWITIDQARINAFADATGDHQWIHVDTARAAAGPFGTTIAHGLLTLSLLPYFMQQIYHVEQVGIAINYGFDRVRFPAPVPVGSRLRASSTIAEITDLGNAVQMKVVTTIEIEGGNKPACVAENIVRFVA